MVKIHLYGKLRRYAREPQNGRGTVIALAPRRDETLASVLVNAGIPVGEINHVFVNAKLLATRTSTAPYLGYVQARPDVLDWDLDVPVGDGDRIGLFGTDMAILGM